MELTRFDVLIVDDDDEIRMTLRRALQRAGLTCADARDGLQALECLERINCAVILLDLMMPGLTAKEFLAKFAKTRRAEQKPIVFAMSAAGDDHVRAEIASGDGVHAIIRKPFDIRETVEIVSFCARRWSPNAGPGAAAT